MIFIPIVIIEIITAMVLLQVSSLPQAKHTASHVLGVTRIAQVSEGTPTQPTEEPSATPTPEEQPTPAPDQNPQPTNESSTLTTKEPILLPLPTFPGEQNVVTQSSSSPNTNAPSAEETSLLDQIIPPQTPPLAEQNNDNAPIPLPSEEQPLQVLQTMSLLNPTDLILSPENINLESLEKAQKEDKKLAEAQTLYEQTELLIDFAKDKVKDIDTFLRADDFASTHFAVQRLSLDIDKTLETIQNVPSSQQLSLKKQLTSFCQQADFILRSAELTVPETSKQDIEISRGKCLNTQL